MWPCINKLTCWLSCLPPGSPKDSSGSVRVAAVALAECYEGEECDTD